MCPSHTAWAWVSRGTNSVSSLPPRVEDEGVARLEDAGQVEEVRALAEAVVHVAVAAGGRLGVQDDEAVGQALHEGAAVGAGGALEVVG